MRSIILNLGIAVAGLLPTGATRAGELTDGITARPACGKICKLVCEKKKLQAVGYGYTCESICIPGPSRHGCKHCDVTCCAGDNLEGCPPKIEFCWYDWFACGCAKPRTIKVLTKYQAEREVDSYHWEVVDASCCDCVTKDGQPANPGAIYKPAPADAELGDVLMVSEAEWAEIAPMLNLGEGAAISAVAQRTSPSSTEPVAPLDAALEEFTPEPPSVAERLQGFFRR